MSQIFRLLHLRSLLWLVSWCDFFILQIFLQQRHYFASTMFHAIKTTILTQMWCYLLKIKNTIFVTEKYLKLEKVIQNIFLRIDWGVQIWTKDHLQTVSITTTILRSHFKLLLHNWPLNNDHLSTTTIIFGSHEWSLYTSLTAKEMFRINRFAYGPFKKYVTL